jgi:hypothetical protein
VIRNVLKEKNVAKELPVVVCQNFNVALAHVLPFSLSKQIVPTAAIAE